MAQQMLVDVVAPGRGRVVNDYIEIWPSVMMQWQTVTISAPTAITTAKAPEAFCLAYLETVCWIGSFVPVAVSIRGVDAGHS